MQRSVMAEAREQSTLEEVHSSDGVLGEGSERGRGKRVMKSVVCEVCFR